MFDANAALVKIEKAMSAAVYVTNHIPGTAFDEYWHAIVNDDTARVRIDCPGKSRDEAIKSLYDDLAATYPERFK